MKVNERISKLREIMDRKGLDAFIIPSSDNHGSEYVSEFFRARAWISGFTGSAGTVVITKNEAHLWTDGRYFIQAAAQLKGTEYVLEKQGEPGVKNHIEWIYDNLKEGAVVGFNGKVLTVAEYENLNSVLTKKNMKISIEEDVLDEIWTDRPAMPKSEMFVFEEKYTGESYKSKLSKVREQMKKDGADNFILGSLDDIAWLLNLRGGDVACNPVFLSYMLIDNNNSTLYLDKSKMNSKVEAYLKDNGVCVKNYEDIKEDVSKIPGTAVVVFDPSKTNVWLGKALNKDIKVIEKRNVTTDLKTIKNETELKNIDKAMVKDGVAMVKFLSWLKSHIGKEKITEMSADEVLTGFRRDNEGFVDISFNSISAYGPNAAIVHYSATEESNTELQPKGLYLIDSGAQYLEGTTDITRTVALGELTEEEKTDYTLTLKGHIALAEAKFLSGTPGCYVDILARKAMWERGIDFKHGTGHGVGFFLNVHEGPQSIRKDVSNIVLEKGMLTSNEPGIYREGKHGIRIENLIVVDDYMETEFGKFMKFNAVTLCPYELDAVDKSLLNEDEIKYINEYHKRVYDKVSPFLNEDQKAWLKEATRAI